jgi:hypothetical protein
MQASSEVGLPNTIKSVIFSRTNFYLTCIFFEGFVLFNHAVCYRRASFLWPFSIFKTFRLWAVCEVTVDEGEVRSAKIGDHNEILHKTIQKREREHIFLQQKFNCFATHYLKISSREANQITVYTSMTLLTVDNYAKLHDLADECRIICSLSCSIIVDIHLRFPSTQFSIKKA